MSIFKSNIDPIERVFNPLNGKHLLDIGCGRGHLCRALGRRGARMTGVDPQAAMLELARSTAPDTQFVQAGCEDLPFEDHSFDGAIILNSLHHVPETVMAAGLAKTMQVIRPGGTFLILEPLARGGYHEVFAPIDDETDIRAKALEILDEFISTGPVTLEFRTEYEITIPEENVESVLSGAIRVNPSRAALVEEKRHEVSKLFDLHAKQSEKGTTLDQPMIAIALKKV